MHRLGLGSAACGLAAVLVACGSTVPPQRQRATDQPATAGGLGAQGGGGVAGSAGPGAPATGGSTAAGTALDGPNPGPPPTSPAPTGQVPGAGAAPAAALGPGVSTTTIAVGIEYIANGSQANAAVGGSSFTTGNELQESNAVVADVNAHGGIAGRRVVPYYATLDPTSAQSVSVQEQAACASLTQDHRVFTVLAAEAHDTFIQCVQNAGASTFLDGGLTDANAEVFSSYPSYVEPSSINLDRLATAEVQVLAAGNYFEGWDAAAGAPGPVAAKVGIVTFDDPRYTEAVDDAMLPALARIGHPVAPADVQFVFEAQTESDAGQESAGVSSAVLRLRQDGVTHVVFLEHGGLPVAFFLNEAQGQAYHPRYGLDTQDAPEALVQGGEVPASQMNGAEGLGWIAGADLPFGQKTDPYLNTPAARRCLAIMQAAGQSPTSADALLVALSICDQMWFLKAAVEWRGPALDRSALLANVSGLGSSYPSALTLATRFSPTQRDGAGAAYLYAYAPGCTCWGYSGSPINIG